MDFEWSNVEPTNIKTIRVPKAEFVPKANLKIGTGGGYDFHKQSKENLIGESQQNVLSFAGGGTRSVTVFTGIVAGIVQRLKKDKTNVNPENTLDNWLDQYRVISGNSGGTWFMSLMCYSPEYHRMLSTTQPITEENIFDIDYNTADGNIIPFDTTRDGISNTKNNQKMGSNRGSWIDTKAKYRGTIRYHGVEPVSYNDKYGKKNPMSGTIGCRIGYKLTTENNQKSYCEDPDIEKYDPSKPLTYYDYMRRKISAIRAMEKPGLLDFVKQKLI